jgi:hypothetical protein
VSACAFDFLEDVNTRGIFDELLRTGRVDIPHLGVFRSGLSFRNFFNVLRDAVWTGVYTSEAETKAKIITYLYSVGYGGRRWCELFCFRITRVGAGR